MSRVLRSPRKSGGGGTKTLGGAGGATEGGGGGGAIDGGGGTNASLGERVGPDRTDPLGI